MQPCSQPVVNFGGGFVDSATGRGLQMLKALCVIGMVAVHSFYWAATSHNGRLPVEETNTLLGIVRHGMVIGVLPLLLPFTAGCALRLEWSWPDGRRRPIAFRELLTHTAVLLALGYSMNLLAGGWYALWSWNVLQFMALSLAVIALVLRLGGTPALAFAGLFVLMASDPLRNRIPFYQGPGWMRILLGDPTDYHTWPFFPWFSTVVFGWLLCEGVLRWRDSACFRVLILVLGSAAAALALNAGRLIPLFDRLNLIGPRVMQPPAVAVVGIIAWAALLTIAFSFVPRFPLKRYGVVRCFNAGILWIYLVHMIVGARAASLAGGWFDQRAVLARPGSLPAVTLLAGFPSAMVLLSWFVGFMAIRCLHEKQIRIRVRRFEPDSCERVPPYGIFDRILSENTWHP